jgi:1-acyl-sn-glycerol-3-phosphate acyltransferase
VLYPISRLLSRVAGAVVWRWRVEGAANVPGTGGVILAANHQSNLDVFLVGGACRRQVRYLARRSLWDDRRIGWLLTDWEAIPMDRERPGKDDFRRILDVVRSGQVLALFPEGTRTRDGSIGELRGGIGFLARRAGVPVVPVLIQGAFEAWPRGRRLPRRGRVRIAFGRPVRYDGSWEDREVAADVRRRLLVLRDGPGSPHPATDGDGAACAPHGGEGAA